MGRRGYSRKGQGEAKTMLVVIELIAVVVILASLIFMIKDKNTVIKHVDLDQELTADAMNALPKGMRVENSAEHMEPLFGDEQNG